MSKTSGATKTSAVYLMPTILGPGERWADRFPELGTEQISYNHMISPELFEIEREAIWRRSWLHVGREMLVPEPGSYITKELAVLKTSIIVVRGQDKKIRAFHNTCPHRGNKLVWKDDPRAEVCGKTERFICKYHGLGFALNGKIDLLQEKEIWFGGQGENMHLSEVPLETWNGFIFVNFTPGGPKQTLREFLGEKVWNFFGDYPFEIQTERTYFTGECRSNWKALRDAFSEGWHGMTLHSQCFPMFTPEQMRYRALRYDIFGEHALWIAGNIPDGMYSFPIERLAEANPLGGRNIGPRDLRILPTSIHPDQKAQWGVVTLLLFPNTEIQIYYPGWTMVYSYWPSAHNLMRFDIEMFHQVPANFSQLFSQKTGTAIAMDALLQDVGTLDATQLGLEARAVETYPLIDEEIIVRHFHKTVRERLAGWKGEERKSAATK